MKKKSFVVIGIDSFGIAITEELIALGCNVTAVDFTMEKLNPVVDIVNYSAYGDVTSESVLKELGLSHADHAVISLERFEDAILVTLMLHDLGVPQITVKVESEYQERIAYKVGASFAIFPNYVMGRRIARKLISSNILDYYDIDEQFGVYELQVNTNKYDQKTLIELDLRNKYEVNIVIIKREGKTFIPKGVDHIICGDIIIVIGKHDKVSKFEDTLGG
ncbi:MAG: potassium channel family protein [Acholeplasmataceae bacterium]|jgi:trk system potassium uptake protein TrkA